MLVAYPCAINTIPRTRALVLALWIIERGIHVIHVSAALVCACGLKNEKFTCVLVAYPCAIYIKPRGLVLTSCIIEQEM